MNNQSEKRGSGPENHGEIDYSIVAVKPQQTAVVKAVVSFAEMSAAQRSARAKISEALPKLGIEPGGQGFTLCRMLDGAKMHYEPGMIVNRAFSAAGDVVSSQLPGGRAVRYRLNGSLDQLGQAWPALFAWCNQQGLKREGTFWEIYGQTSNDSSKQKVTLYALLA